MRMTAARIMASLVTIPLSLLVTDFSRSALTCPVSSTNLRESISRYRSCGFPALRILPSPASEHYQAGEERCPGRAGRVHRQSVDPVHSPALCTIMQAKGASVSAGTA
jgi:hypothetical protein